MESPTWAVTDLVPAGCAVVFTFAMVFVSAVLGWHLLKVVGPAKSFSSDVNDAELRVLAMKVEMQGLSPSTVVRSTPISVKAFAGSCVIEPAWLSNAPHAPAPMVSALLKAQTSSPDVPSALKQPPPTASELGVLG